MKEYIKNKWNENKNYPKLFKVHILQLQFFVYLWQA